MALLQWTKDYFARSGVDSPRLAAEVLLAHVLKCRRIELYARYEYAPRPDELDAYRELVRRAAGSEPIAYLVGGREFYSLWFKVNEVVLIPRPETELLVDSAVEYFRGRKGGKMWDACTGNGCVAVAVAKNCPDVKILATDISTDALEVAGENARTHGVDERITPAQADLLELPAEFSEKRPFDVITVNPPYVPDDVQLPANVQNEPAAALRGGADGLDYIRCIDADAPAHLVPGGQLVMEFGDGQSEAVRRMLEQNEQFTNVQILTDHRGMERAASATRK